MRAGKETVREKSFKKKKQSDRGKAKKKEFRRIFLGISISLTLAVFLSVGVMNEVVRSLITEQNVNDAMEMFTQIQGDFEERNQAANRLATQILLDDVCHDMLYAGEEQPLKSWILTPIYRQINQYQYTSPMVDSIYIYSRPQELFLVSENWWGGVEKADFWDEEIVDILERPEAYDTGDLIYRNMTVRDIQRREWKEMTYSYVLFTNLTRTGSAVVINLQMDDLVEEISKLRTMQDSRMLIINERGERLLDIKTCPIADSEALEDEVASMMEAGESYRKAEVDGSVYFISYLYSEDTGWSYVKISDWDTMFSVLKELNRWFTGLILSMVTVVLLVALWNTLSVVRFHRSLEEKYLAMLPPPNVFQQRENFLNNFIHSRKLFTRAKLREEMELIGFRPGEGSLYTLLVLQIENYERFVETYEKKDIYNIKFGFENIFEEIFQEQFHVVGLINQDSTITFLLEISGTAEVWETIERCFRSFCEKVGIFVPWNFFCLGTRQRVSLEKIPELNSYMQRYVQEGFFYPSNSVVAWEQVQEEHHEEGKLRQPYLEKWERGLQNGQNLKELYRELTQSLQHCRMAEYMHAVMWAGITVSKVAGSLFGEETDINGMLQRLSRCGKAWKVDEQFEALFDAFQDRQAEEARSGLAGRLDAVMEYVAAHYSDPNLTLKTLGDTFGVSSNYLGRLFKKDMGLSVAEYINEVRLKHVLKELRETGDSAREIAERNGFVSTSNYFYTYFKKKMGVTPQAYRELEG